MPENKLDAKAANPTSSEGTRVQILFDDAAVRTVGELKARYKVGSPTTATLIRDALGFFSWAAEELRQGRKVGSFKAEGGAMREIFLPFRASEDGK